MKKILFILGILSLICINCVYADNEITVSDTAETAVNLTTATLPYFGENFERVYNYCVNNNYITENSKYVLFPSKVEYDSFANNFLMTFQLLKSASANDNDQFVVISHNSVIPAAFPGHYDFWVSYTGDWVDITGNTFFVTCSFDGSIISQDVSVSNNTSYVASSWGMRWQTNFIFDNLNTRYLLVSDFQNVAQFGGLYYSVYSSQDLLKTYLYYYNGTFSSGSWNDWYEINPNYVINVFRHDSSNISNINTEVYVTSNSIIFNNDVSNNETMDLNINSIWGTLKSYVYNLIAGLTSVASLFQVVFSWLPSEITSVIYVGLILCIVLLLIKAFRGG